MSAALLAVWPWAASPFHEPKRWVLIIGALCGLVLARQWRWFAVPLLVVGLLQDGRASPAGLQWIAFGLAMMTWPALRPTVATTRVVVLTGSVVGCVVLLQALGWDPLGAAHPDATGARLKLYGTLGNPDFVASCLLPIAMLGLAEREGRWRAAIVPSVAALALIQSVATLLALVAGTLALLLHPARSGSRRAAWSMVALLAVLAISLGGRRAGPVLEGRRYLTAVSAPYVREAPFWGHGAGSTVVLWPEWELRWWQARCADAECVQAHPDSRFAGRQDHVHNDWLELLLERGAIGLGAFLLAISVPLRTLGRRRDLSAAVLLSAFVALLVRSCADFPLSRPADLCLLALVSSLACTPQEVEAS